MIEEKLTNPYPAQAGSDKKPNGYQYQLFAFKMLGDFGASIAVPVVLFVLLGQYLDGRYGKSPLFTIIGFVLAALLTAKIIYKKAKRYGEEYKKMNEE
jgi:F0F1-type ATP synthase assembly protein I